MKARDWKRLKQIASGGAQPSIWYWMCERRLIVAGLISTVWRPWDEDDRMYLVATTAGRQALQEKGGVEND